MPKRPRYFDIAKVLIKHYGYAMKSRKGRHVWLIDALGHRVTILATNEQVNLHNYKSILKQTGLTEEEIEKYL
jgi:predicted RNA binding protein YcfA (HicA-like mRNA interferase family)